MPVFSKPLAPHHKALVGAAVAIPLIATACLVAMRMKKPTAGGASTAAGKKVPVAEEVAQWSEAQVKAWLVGLGVTEPSIAIFTDNGIDGATLLMLHEGHLEEMGVTKMGDRLKLKTNLAKIRTGGDAESATAPATVTSRSASAGTAKKSAADEAEHIANVTRMVVQNLEELFSVFGSDEFIQLPQAQQRSLIAKAETSYASVVAAIRQLPPAHQEKLMAFADNFAGLLTEVKKAFGPSSAAAAMAAPSSASASAAAAEGGGDVLPEAASAAAVQQLVPLLKQFHEALESPAMVNASLEQRQEICESILSQVVRMKQMCARLHPAHGEALATICDRIIGIAQQLLAGKKATASEEGEGGPAPPARGVAVAGTASEAQATPQILARLRTLFDTLKNPAFLDSLSTLPPKEIRSIVARMRGEINQIAEETEARVKDPQQRKLITGVIDNVVAILSQVSMLGATKVEGSTPVKPQPQDMAYPSAGSNAASPDSEANSPNTMAAYKAQKESAERANNVAARLKQILRILEQPEYRANPVPYRDTILEELSECRDVIAGLPDETKLPLTQLMAKILEVFQMSLQAAARATPQATPALSASAAAPSAADDEDDFEPSPAFNAIKKSLEGVFAALNSEEFQQGERHTQNRFCQRLYGMIQQIKQEIATKVKDEAEKDALSQLSDSLSALIEKLLEGTGPAATKSAATGTTNDNDAEDEEAAPKLPITPQAAIAKVQEVKNVLINPQFGALPPADQLKVASGMLADLKDVEAKILAAASISAVDPVAVPPQHVALYKEHVVPIVKQMRGAVEGLIVGLKGGEVPEEDANEEGDAYANDEFEEEGEEAAEDEDDFDANPRKGLFGTVKRATELIHAGRISTIADVKECMALLQDVDKVGIESEEERETRNAFMIAIRDLTTKMRDQNDAALKAKQAAADEDDEDDEDVPPTAAAAAGSRPKAIAVLIAKMKLILEDIEYRADKFNSLSELLPYMTTVETMLGDLDSADGAAVSWKSDPEAVEIVSETLSRIQDIQEQIANKASEGSRDPSELEGMLAQYREMLVDGFEQGGINDRAHLAPFMEVVHQTHGVEGLTIEENHELMKLQKAILAVNEALLERKEEEGETDGAAEAEADEELEEGGEDANAAEAADEEQQEEEEVAADGEVEVEAGSAEAEAATEDAEPLNC